MTQPQAGDEHLVYCDGSCLGNPGPGGWGAVIMGPGTRIRIAGSAPDATNSTMELTAAIEALETIAAGATVRIISDSSYVTNGMNKWLAGWKQRGWRNASGKAVKNRALWERLDAAHKRHRRVQYTWVRGHSGDPGNEYADQLAQRAARRQIERFEDRRERAGS